MAWPDWPGPPPPYFAARLHHWLAAFWRNKRWNMRYFGLPRRATGLPGETCSWGVIRGVGRSLRAAETKHDSLTGTGRPTLRLLSGNLQICWQWRRSVIKSEGGHGYSGQAIKLEADRNSFSFSAPKMGYLVIFGFFLFGPKMNFHFWFIFRFRLKKCHLRWAENVMFAT